MLAAESLFANKLKRHLEATHNNLQGNSREFFARKLREQKHHSTSLFSRASFPSKALLVSYQVVPGIAKYKKPHTTAVNLILPAAIDIVSVMITKSATKQTFRLFAI